MYIYVYRIIEYYLKNMMIQANKLQDLRGLGRIQSALSKLNAQLRSFPGLPVLGIWGLGFRVFGVFGV